MDAVVALRELQEARGVLPETELAFRARQILDRADLQELDLVVFLASHGYAGARLMRAAGAFGRALSESYLEVHGVRPVKAEVFVPGVGRRHVNIYLESDRQLVESTFAEWSK